MESSNFLDSKMKLGTIFTPMEWGQFAVQEFGIFDKWINGATVFDPTMGEGDLLFSLVEHGLRKGYLIKDMPINNLFGNEINTEIYESFFHKKEQEYGVKLNRNNFSNGDIFFQNVSQKYDFLFGNPPWQNFVDLPEDYKKRVKHLFIQYGLTGNTKELLLGGARIDIAALTLQKVIEENLKKNGEGVFFLPLSLFLNDGAHKIFRKYTTPNSQFYVDKIIDFNDLNIFPEVSTRYGLIHLHRDKKQQYPIDFLCWTDGSWEKHYARPLFSNLDPLSVSNDSSFQSSKFVPIQVRKHAQPRQGVNTCGANEIYFFNSYKELNNSACEVANKEKKQILPKKYIFPLVTSLNFKEVSRLPHKWVLIPHGVGGKPLSHNELISEPLLYNYLIANKKKLQNRKGQLINAWIKRGLWWALLGVGEYNFLPYKIIWEAYGKKFFNPIIFTGNWQANQSLQAFISTKNLSEAEEISYRLRKGDVQEYLSSLKMEGTMNWAQPGKIKKLLVFKEDVPKLF